MGFARIAVYEGYTVFALWSHFATRQLIFKWGHHLKRKN